jgi:pimeloyl-ACP methyl ester carboxylesterase
VRLLPYLVSLAWAASHPELLAELVAAARDRPVPPYARRLHYLASEGHDAWDLLPTIEAPTLVVHGSEDLVNVAANAPLLVEGIPGAVLHIIIAGARHDYFWENRPEASQRVLDFLARHPLDS